MKRIITFLRKTHYKMLCKIWWPFINNIKWHNIRATTKEVLSINKVKTLTDIKDLITKLYFLIDKSSKSDNQLFKGVCPPSYLYMKYVTETLSDEYNDFVTLIYHILSANEIECHQVAVCAPKICHRILIFKINDRWYANDYNLIYEGFESLKACVENYNNIFCDNYWTQKVWYNYLLDYNYKKAKFKSHKIK